MQTFLSAENEKNHVWITVFLWILILCLFVLGMWLLGMGWIFWTNLPVRWCGRLNALSMWYWGLGIIALGLVMALLLRQKKQLKYVLEAQGLTVALEGLFIQFKRHIPYERIESVQAGTFQAGWREMGLEMPGIYLGSFTASGGKSVELATTRKKGNMVCLSIKNETGSTQRLVLSPEEPSRFVEALKVRLAERRVHQNSLNHPPQSSTGRFFFSVGMMVSFAWFIMLAVGLLIAWMMPSLPDRVPMHFDLLGRVDRMGRKREIWAVYALTFGLTLPFPTFLSLVIKDRISRILLSGTGLYISFGLALLILGILFTAKGY